DSLRLSFHGDRDRPESGVFVVARRQGPAVRAEGRGADRTFVEKEWADRLARGRVPEPAFSALTPLRSHCEEDHLAVGATGLVAQDGTWKRWTKGLVRVRPPETGATLDGSCQQEAPIGAEGHLNNSVRMGQVWPDRRAGGRIPEPGRPVLRTAGE